MERRLKPVHALAAIAVALVGVGIAVASYDHTVAKVTDVEALKASTAATFAVQNQGTAYQLNALQHDAQAQRERMARVEATLTAVGDDMKFVREQLVEIARATGARQPPSPPASPIP